MAANQLTKTAEKGSFQYDLEFLNGHDQVIVLNNPGEPAQVIVSARYQGKVFTSTADGPDGKSFGWINYKAFSGPEDKHMNAYGGENRFWLGPEGGMYSLYFGKGKKMAFENWKTPAPIDTEPWKIAAKNDQSVQLEKDMKLVNYTGSELAIKARRSVRILTRKEIASLAGVAMTNGLKAVGYETVNSIANTGPSPWTEKTGMPCIWILDMFNPSPKTTIAIPYRTDVPDSASKIATTNYFGEIPADRIKYHGNVLLFKADGKSRGKLGLDPSRAKPVAGSYDAQNSILTITTFDVDANGRYLNQEWKTSAPPFSGDAVNAYNDGPLEDGSQMGPFYELESVSPAAFLKPGESLTHRHSVFHFTGEKRQLDAISVNLLGISIEAIEKSF